MNQLDIFILLLNQYVNIGNDLLSFITPAGKLPHTLPGGFFILK
jgi:hypothetical protein